MTGWYVSGRVHKKPLTVVVSREASWRVRVGVTETAFLGGGMVLNITPSVCIPDLKARQTEE